MSEGRGRERKGEEWRGKGEEGGGKGREGMDREEGKKRDVQTGLISLKSPNTT